MNELIERAKHDTGVAVVDLTIIRPPKVTERQADDIYLIVGNHPFFPEMILIHEDSLGDLVEDAHIVKVINECLEQKGAAKITLAIEVW